MIATYKSYAYSPDGMPLLTFKVADKGIVRELKTDQIVDLSVKTKRPKRTLTQNSYFWELLSKLAPVLKTSRMELYHKYVRESGIFSDIPIPRGQAQFFIEAWSSKGYGWLAEETERLRDVSIYRFYKGSSVYTTEQMAQLLDSVIEDCKELDIETASPQELMEMRRYEQAHKSLSYIS